MHIYIYVRWKLSKDSEMVESRVHVILVKWGTILQLCCESGCWNLFNHITTNNNDQDANSSKSCVLLMITT